MAQFVQSGTPINLTTTGILSEINGALLGFFVNTTSAGTIVLNTGGAAGGTSGGTAISGTITPAAGAFYAFPANTPTRMYATIGGTLNVTFFFAAG